MNGMMLQRTLLLGCVFLGGIPAVWATGSTSDSSNNELRAETASYWGLEGEQDVPVCPNPNSWADSYSVDGKCYCQSTYDHGVGDITFETPAGVKTVREICEKIGPGPGMGNNPRYNTVHCGHEPGHPDKIWHTCNGETNYIADEKLCPGRVDLGPEGCNQVGPMWDLSVFEPLSIPGKIEAEDFNESGGVQPEETQDEGGGQNIGFIQNGSFVSYDVVVKTAGTYEVSFRVASNTTGGTIQVANQDTILGEVQVTHTTGWQNWETVVLTLDLAEGPQSITLNFIGNESFLFNVNWVDFVLTVVTEVSDKEAHASIEVFPNPITNGELQIDFPSTVFLKEWRIVDLKGRVLRMESPHDLMDRLELDVSALQEGAYMLVFLTPEGEKSTSFQVK